jgi:hypothetical protein
MPNGRILRLRLNLARSWSGETTVEGVSVYGTRGGFRGRARPGGSWFIDAALEYSLTRRWALAADFAWWHNSGTRVDGVDAGSGSSPPLAVHRKSQASEPWAIAPAIEYSFSERIGVLLGARFMAGRNTTTTVTPVVAVNFVR